MSTFGLYRQIEHKGRSANARLNWVLTLSGLLFVVLALNVSRDTDPLFYKVLKAIIPLTGLVLSLTAVFGAAGARNVVRALKRKWKKIKSEQRVPSFGDQRFGELAIIPGLLMAVPLLIIWLIILIVILLS